MEDFDIFTNKIEFTKAFRKNMLNKLVYDHRSTPIGANYESGNKLLAEECLVNNDEESCAFHLSEGVSASVRTMTLYREEQIRAARDKLYKITPYLKPIHELTSRHPISKSEQSILDTFDNDTTHSTSTLDELTTVDEEMGEVPFHKQYLHFSELNNVDNFNRILRELPKEWTIVQLSARYNGRENVVPRSEYRTDVARAGLLVTVLAGDHVTAPFTVHVPAYVAREGEKGVFTELYDILDENYKTIDNAHTLNNKRLVQNYWARREDIDLRMKSVIKCMDERWLGGWSCLLSGRVTGALRDQLVARVDAVIADWGLICVSEKQRMLVYKLMSSAGSLTSHQTRTCLRRILLEHGDRALIRDVLRPCQHCSNTFRLITELCSKCLSATFEKVHKLKVEDGVRAFEELAMEIREGGQWAGLRGARRCPVILIVDEILDSFPWECVGGRRDQPMSRLDSVHSLYHLYKSHESSVHTGHYVTSHTGRYVINPEKNLDRMEKRMSSFVQYWCESWRGHTGHPPPPDDFLNYLRTADIFLYCGHGDGCQFGSGGSCGAGVEGASGARAVCLLSGCGSVRLQAAPARQPPHAAHRRLHVAGCPSVVGMLWEVTDLEVDKVVTTLVSLCVPSDATVPWHGVGKTDWSRGIIDTSVTDWKPVPCERELLRAVCRARSSTNYLMIASSVVVRGLPVIIQDVPGVHGEWHRML